MALSLPKVAKLLYEVNSNEIWQYFSGESSLASFNIISTNPFVINCDEINYLLTSNKADENIEAYDNVLLTFKKPIKSEVLDGSIKFKYWLKHPAFVSYTPEVIINSWKGNFNFVKEDEANNIKGLRPPQMGALFSILAHIQNPEDKAIIVMPTGTGKTETMLSTLIANECKKLLVSVPSDSLRSQIGYKFITLGLLKEFGIAGEDCLYPIVGILRSGIRDNQVLKDFISNCNVVVSTMDLLVNFNNEERIILRDSFSHFFVDEAHHSEASTWKELISKFEKEKVFLFTATPYRKQV